MLKDGLQACTRCGGTGCYRCFNKGYTVSCPACANFDPSILKRSGDDFLCSQCGTEFNKGGKIVTPHTDTQKNVDIYIKYTYNPPDDDSRRIRRRVREE